MAQSASNRSTPYKQSYPRDCENSFAKNETGQSETNVMFLTGTMKTVSIKTVHFIIYQDKVCLHRLKRQVVATRSVYHKIPIPMFKDTIFT